MLADPKKQLTLLQNICDSIYSGDEEVAAFAESINDDGVMRLYPEYLPRAEHVIKTFESSFLFEDFRTHVQIEPVQVRYLINIRFFNAFERLKAETKCPCFYPDDLREFLCSELIEKDPSTIHWTKIPY